MSAPLWTHGHAPQLAELIAAAVSYLDHEAKKPCAANDPALPLFGRLQKAVEAFEDEGEPADVVNVSHHQPSWDRGWEAGLDAAGKVVERCKESLPSYSGGGYDALDTVGPFLDGCAERIGSLPNPKHKCETGDDEAAPMCCRRALHRWLADRGVTL